MPFEATSSAARSSVASLSSQAGPADTREPGLHAPQPTSFKDFGSEHLPLDAVLQQPVGGAPGAVAAPLFEEETLLPCSHSSPIV